MQNRCCQIFLHLLKSVFVATSPIVAAKRLKCIIFYQTVVPVFVWHYKYRVCKHKSIAKSIMKVYDSFSLDHFKPFVSESQRNFAQISLLKWLENEKTYSTTATMVVEQAFIKLFEFYRTPINLYTFLPRKPSRKCILYLVTTLATFA